MEQDITGRLEDWFYDGVMVWGNLYEDTKQRWYDGVHIHTSAVLTDRMYIKEGEVIQTRNSRYLLGKPLESKEFNVNRPTTGSTVRVIKGTAQHDIPITTICEIVDDWGQDTEFPYELRNKETGEVYENLVAEDELEVI